MTEEASATGHYYMEDYQTAKEDFTFRSGLMAREQVFDRERLEELRQAAPGFPMRTQGPASYWSRNSGASAFWTRFDTSYPNRSKNWPKEGPSIEQSM